MLPMKAVRLQLGDLLAADATTLAPAANANEIVLVKAAFTPSEDMVIGDLTLADFDGYAPKAGVIGSQEVGIDPATGQQVITLKEAAGGWRFEVTGVTNLPQTIHGFGLTDSTGATLLAVQLLEEPVTLSAVGHFIDLGVAEIALNESPMS